MTSDILVLYLFELAAIIFAAKLGGEICERYLKQPAVVGELAMGMIIGPYVLGKIPIPGLGPLFPMVLPEPGQVITSPVSSELYVIAQLAVIILLFSAGLGTDFGQFFRFAGPASLVAIGGIAFCFILGAAAAVFSAWQTVCLLRLPCLLARLSALPPRVSLPEYYATSASWELRRALPPWQPM